MKNDEITKNCDFCGSEITATRTTKKYCSNSCRTKANLQRRENERVAAEQKKKQAEIDEKKKLSAEARKIKTVQRDAEQAEKLRIMEDERILRQNKEAEEKKQADAEKAKQRAERKIKAELKRKAKEEVPPIIEQVEELKPTTENQQESNIAEPNPQPETLPVLQLVESVTTKTEPEKNTPSNRRKFTGKSTLDPNQKFVLFVIGGAAVYSIAKAYLNPSQPQALSKPGITQNPSITSPVGKLHLPPLGHKPVNKLPSLAEAAKIFNQYKETGKNP